MAESPEEVAPLPPFNFNIGVLGHVDCGKTSLVKALSTHLSTASLDKSKQSRQRGMTLDLGFSSLVRDVPEHLREAAVPQDKVQFTFVDCPGHASLIKTIIGGAQIIDMMILVVDALKGFQTQTAECLVIGEITTDQIVVVLNKCDTTDAAGLEKMKAQLAKTLEKTRFKDAPIIATAACVGGEKRAATTEGEGGGGGGGGGAKDKTAAEGKTAGEAEAVETIGLPTLVDAICQRLRWPERSADAPLYFAVDHCFPIRGSGTVMTGTVLRGCIKVNQTVEIPQLGLEKKIKSMQMFHRAAEQAVQGDRVGVCVTNFDSKLLERGIVATPGSVPLLSSALVQLRKVRFFKGSSRRV